METINGIHCGNFEWDKALEVQGRIVGGAGCVSILHSDMSQYHYWRNISPTIRIHIRNYTPNWFATNPELSAREFLGAIGDAVHDPFVLISPANEQDLACEGHPDAATAEKPHIHWMVYNEIWEWQRRWFAEINRAVPVRQCLFMSGPLAGGHDVEGMGPDSEYLLRSAMDVYEMVDVLGLHMYFFPDGNGTRADNGGYWHGIRALRPKGFDSPENVGGAYTTWRKPFFVSEFGNFRHHDSAQEAVATTIKGYDECYAAYAATGKCIGVTPFIWNSQDEHRENRIWGNGPLIEGLMNMEKYEIKTPTPGIEWTLGFKDYAASHPEVGVPISGLNYDDYGNAWQYSLSGLLFWHKADNQIHWFRRG